MVLSVVILLIWVNFTNKVVSSEEFLNLALPTVTNVNNEEVYGTTTKDEDDVEIPPFEILDTAKFISTYDDTPAIQITVKWTNTTDKIAHFSQLFYAQAFQGGMALDIGYPGFDRIKSENEDYTDIQPGATQEVIFTFEVRSEEEDVTFNLSAGYELSYEKIELESKIFKAPGNGSEKDDKSKESDKKVS